MLSNKFNIKNDHTSAESNDSHTIPNTQNEEEVFYDALDDVIPGLQKDDVSNLKEKWKKLDPAKKAGLVGAIVGTLITLSPLIGVLATLTLPGLILGGIAYGVTKTAKSKGVKTVAEKTTEGMKHIGKEVKSKGKNVVDNLKFTKELSGAQKLIQDINSEISKLVVASKSELTKKEDRNNTEKFAFQKEIAEMIQKTL